MKLLDKFVLDCFKGIGGKGTVSQAIFYAMSPTGFVPEFDSCLEVFNSAVSRLVHDGFLSRVDYAVFEVVPV